MPPISELAVERYVNEHHPIDVQNTGIHWQNITASHYHHAVNDDVPAASFDEPVGGVVKRALDLIIAMSALLFLMPIILFTVALVLVTMGRPIFFSQQRVGFNGQKFQCLKFRSMVKDAARVLDAHLEACPRARFEWAQNQKLRDDPRVTWLGRILRKSSLDELPQLFNILKGEMSCIGPRPVLPKELERYGRYRSAYKSVRPGLTGLWQVSGRSNTSYEERVKLDRIYIRRWSLAFDIRILLRTVPVLFKFDETA
ncbi:MAG TPA: sugar transferase [Hyphomicrobiales bacterium]|nr:sugar transferase [Hyphomicrobiales bacterium]